MKQPRVVAELGRPETPEETAARKAESSRVHRESRTFRNGIVALLVSLAVVVVIVFAVPRGSFPEQQPVDVDEAAAAVAESRGDQVVVPEVPDAWVVNGAAVEGDVWTIVYAPPSGFLRVAQRFDADEAWPSRVLSGRAPTGATTIDGIEWDVYEISDPESNANIDYALSTQAGTDTILIYGATTAKTAAVAAEGLSDDIRGLREETQ